MVVGSVLDEGISRGLQERLDRVEGNLDDTVALIDEKNEEIEDLREFSRSVAPFAGEDRLTGTTTLVVAEPGIANQAVEDTVGSLRAAGSSVEGIVWIEASWSLEDEEGRRRFEEIAGESGRTVQQLQSDVIDGILAEASPAEPSTTQPPADDGVAGADGTRAPTPWRSSTRRCWPSCRRPASCDSFRSAAAMPYRPVPGRTWSR